MKSIRTNIFEPYKLRLVGEEFWWSDNMKHTISECISFWSELSEKHRKRLEDNTIYRSYRCGENVIFKTVKKDGIIFVLGGELRVYLASGGGREVTLFHLSEGDAFSIMTVDNASDTDVVPSLQALESTKLAYLQRSDMAPVAYDEPLFAKFVFETCAKTAQAILNNIYYCIFNSVRSCICRELAIQDALGGYSGTVLVTHEEIANNLGTTRVVVSRELDHLRDLGLIRTGRGKIYILDRKGLEGIASCREK